MAYEVNVEGHEVAVERNGMEWKLYVDSDLRDSVRESFAEFLATMPWTTILRASIGCRDGRKVGIKFEISSGAMSNYVRFLLADKKIKNWKNRTVTRRPASGDTGGPVSPMILFVRTLLATGIIAVTILMIINGVGSRSASNGPASTASVPVPPSSATLRQEQALRTGSPPKIERVETFREGALVFVRLFFNDPDNDATGFGFRGVNGARWAMENHPFSSPSYGRVSPGKIEYPFNHGCRTGREYESDVEAWIFDKAGLRSRSVIAHLACSAPSSRSGTVENSESFRESAHARWKRFWGQH